MANASSPQKSVGIVGFIAAFSDVDQHAQPGLFSNQLANSFKAPFARRRSYSGSRSAAAGGENILCGWPCGRSLRERQASGGSHRIRQEAQVINARGNVQLDYLTQHVEADDARYELKNGHGTFHHVRATFAIQRRPTATLLISPNPLYFEAEEAERVDENTYRVSKAWFTVCIQTSPRGNSTRRRQPSN